MHKEKISIVMVGIGHAHAQEVMKELLAQADVFHVLGFVEQDPQILRKKRMMSPFDTLERLTESDVLNNKKDVIDAIFIETEMQSLIATARAYLSLQVPIHLDKPTGIGHDFIDFLKEAQQRKVPVQLGYMYRYHPAIMEVNRYIQEQKIGELCYIHAFMNTELQVEQRKSLKQFPGGAMYVYGCHMLDILMRFQGQPKRLHSFIKQSGFQGVKVEDSTLAVLEYERGTSIIEAICVDANGYGRRQIVISGTEGSIEIKPLENPIKMTYAKRDGKDAYQDKAIAVDLSNSQLHRRYFYMISDFAHMVKEETEKMLFPMDYDYEKALHLLFMQAVNAPIREEAKI